VPSPLCILEISRPIHIGMAVKNTTISMYLVPPDFSDNIALLYSSSDLYVQPEDGLTARGRNMYLAETFVHKLTPCILHKYSCVLTAISI